MSAVSPYRAHPRRVSTVVVAPLAFPRRLLVALVGVVVAPMLLHVFLWSRVVTVRCERSAEGRIACDVEESTLASSDRFRRDATGADEAALRGATRVRRGSTWIALVGPSGEAELTSGFNGDKEGQHAAADRLTDFLADPGEPSVTVTFGSRWGTAWIFLGIDALIAVLLYPIFAQRLRLRADRDKDVLEVARGFWPFFGKPYNVPLRRLARFTVAPEGKRYRLVAVSEDEQTHPISLAAGLPQVFEPAVAKLNAWMLEERERHGSDA